jgi:hypothetical protein
VPKFSAIAAGVAEGFLNALSDDGVLPVQALGVDLEQDGHTVTVSLALNAGVPVTEVARRAGHSVATLLKIYAHCIDGQADAANKRIADALGGDDKQDEQAECG